MPDVREAPEALQAAARARAQQAALASQSPQGRQEAALQGQARGEGGQVPGHRLAAAGSLGWVWPRARAQASGVYVRTVEDRPQAADEALIKHMNVYIIR